MTRRELALKSLSNELAIWQVQIQNLNSLNLYDANLFSENSLCDILNVIFNFRLKNVNPIVRNHPAIDLGDMSNRVAVQVTSTKSKSKIQYTIDKFFENDLDKVYDELYIVILGDKQKSYSSINIDPEFFFEKNKHIIDFKDLLKQINSLPTEKIERIYSLVQQEKTQKTNNNKLNVSAFKRKLSLKKKLEKDLIRPLTRTDMESILYSPYLKFIYQSVIIRSIEDKNWPNVDESTKSNIRSWFKAKLWDFYDNGIELISMTCERVIFDNDGNWDILDSQVEHQLQTEKYRVENLSAFLRIPYDYIVAYDMEPDDYHGLPTIYVEYANNQSPFEEEVFGLVGFIDRANNKRRLTTYFDNNNRSKYPF